MSRQTLTVSGRVIASYSARSRSGCAHGRSGRVGSFHVDPRTHDHHTADSVFRDDDTAHARTRAIHGKHRRPESSVLLRDGLSLAAHTSVEVHGVNAVDTPGRGRPCDGSRETTPRHGFDDTSDTGTLPMTHQVSREAT